MGRPSFAEVAKDRILIGVLDRGNELGSIPKDQWRWVKAALANVIFDVLLENPGTPPACKDAGWYQGTYKICPVYPGARLEVVDWKDIPVRPRARAWVPTTPSAPKSILNVLQMMNPALPTSDWRVIRVEDADGPSRQRASSSGAAMDMDIEAPEPEPEPELSDAESNDSSQSNYASTMRRVFEEEELLYSDGECEADVTVVAMDTPYESTANQSPHI
ncbi:uncharacterized protein LOC118732743 [Rhagoletis pomonella]|uniref:uncharacterized protein LOC118732743 n=1 Tax=Rhagoletis pomonella TaxID=28610 RepID=UPI0017845C92|nr:uncharacterized protein LOC118732743 [Rhagoletis pomonella]